MIRLKYVREKSGKKHICEGGKTRGNKETDEISGKSDRNENRKGIL